jgi:hypothetical protein
MHRAYLYRLHPSRPQQRRLLKQLEVCRKLYNYLLDLNVDVYKSFWVRKPWASGPRMNHPCPQ